MIGWLRKLFQVKSYTEDNYDDDEGIFSDSIHDDDDDFLYEDHDSFHESDSTFEEDFITDSTYCFLDTNIFHDMCDSDHYDSDWDDTYDSWDSWDDPISSWDDDW